MRTHWNIFLYFLYQALTLEGISHGLYVLWLIVEKGQSPATAALLLVAGDVILTFFQIPAGLFADRFGRRRSLALGSVAQAAGILGLWLGDTLLHLTLASVAIGVGDAFREGADEALLHDSLHQLNRQEEFGRLVAQARQYAQVVLVLLVLSGGWMASHYGYHWVWAAEFALAVLGLLVAVAMREVKVQTHQDTEPELKLSRALPPWRLLLPTSVTVVLACSTSFGVEAGWRGEAFSLTLIVALTMLFEGLGAGMAASRFGTLKLSYRLATISLFATCLITFVPSNLSWVFLIFVSICTSFCHGVSDPVRMAEIQGWAHPRLRATAASAAYTCDMLVQTLGLCLFGWLLETHGLGAACLSVSLFVVLLASLAPAKGGNSLGR